MKLLIFAHRLEAQAFLDAYKWQAIGQNLYQFEDLLLSYSGEGIMEASFSLQKLLILNPEITEVIHYGLAGALSSQLDYQDIYEIRTVFKQKSWRDMEFQSFTLNPKGKVDLVSAIDRITDDADKNYLANFSQLVDRELWAYSFVCKKENVPIKAYKIVSDFADQKECSQIKEKAEDFSLKMLQHFQKENPTFSFEKTEEISLPEGFYFTENLKVEYKKLIKALQTKWGQKSPVILQQIGVQGILNKDIAAKEKTKLLLQALEEKMDPEFYLYKKEMKDYMEQVKQKGLQLSMGKFFEPSEAEIRFRFQDKKDFQTKLNQLKSMDLSKLYGNEGNAK